MKTVMLRIGLIVSALMPLCACSSIFTVKSDPLEAEVSYQSPKTGEKKPLGKTPLSMPSADLRKAIGDDIKSGEFFTVVVEKKGFATQSFSVPVAKFGTMVTALDVKLKPSTADKEANAAQDIINHLFLAQKLALSSQYERAQIELDKILAEYPTFPRALSMRASIFYAQKNYSESLKWYDEALKADPQMEDAVKMSAKVRALKEGRVPASAAASTSGPLKKDSKQ